MSKNYLRPNDTAAVCEVNAVPCENEPKRFREEELVLRENRKDGFVETHIRVKVEAWRDCTVEMTKIIQRMAVRKKATITGSFQSNGSNQNWTFTRNGSIV